MRLCIPTTSDGGRGARISPHFGSAPYFTLVDTETGETRVIVNEHARHEHGRCDPVRAIAGEPVEAAVCRGLGRRALARLSDRGIAVLATEAWTVAAALEQYQTGRLRTMEPEEACGGHHEEQHVGRPIGGIH